MFTRIVKMDFEKNNVESFLENFQSVKSKIRNFPGCQFLELYKDKNSETIFFTYSRWEDEKDLEAYRKSDLFREVWSVTKPLFQNKAEAWSVDTLVCLP